LSLVVIARRVGYVPKFRIPRYRSSNRTHAFKRMEKIEEVRFTKCATMLRNEPKINIFCFIIFVFFVKFDKKITYKLVEFRKF